MAANIVTSIAIETDADTDVLALVPLYANGFNFTVDPQEFCSSFNAGAIAGLDTDGCTLSLTRLPDGRIYIYLDPTSGGPICFTLSMSAEPGIGVGGDVLTDSINSTV